MGIIENIFGLAKTQPTAIYTYVIAKYVLETFMPTKLGIYDISAKYFIDLCGGLYTYMSHMKALQSTM